MRFVLIMTGLCALLAGCERYTEKKSPCFGTTGKSIVTRAAQTPLTISAPSPHAKGTSAIKDCVFQDLSSPLE